MALPNAPRNEGPRPAVTARRPLDLTDFDHLDFVGEVFLPEARARASFTPEQDAVLMALLGELFTEASGGLGPAQPEDLPEQATGPATVPPAATVAAPAGQPVTPVPASTPPAQPTPVLQPRPPSPTRLWWERTMQAVGSDLAVNGLAYLGVLLFFVGAFGLVAFAFGDVATGLRPLAELVIAVTPFAAGALLRRRRAQVVGRALEIAGGLVLPVMVVTSVLDGVSFPPDLTGVALVVVLTAALVALATGYALWSRKVPDSALRYLVAPVGWLAVGIATMGVGRDIPAGRAVATPSAIQVSAMAAALLLTVAWARIRPGQRLSKATATAAMPGLVVIGALALLTWTAEGWPVVAVLIDGIAVLVVLELLADRIPEPITGIAAPVWWLVTLAGLITVIAVEPGQVGALATLGAVGFIAILERAGTRHRGVLALPAIGLALTLGTVAAAPQWATGAFFVTAAWAALRRTRPYRTRRAPVLLDLANALALVVALVMMAAAVDVPSALLSGAGVVLVTARPVCRGWLDRAGAAGYWLALWTGLVLLVTVAAVALWSTWATRELWLVAAAFAVIAVAAWAGPLAIAARLPTSLAMASMAWLAAAAALGIPADVRHIILAGAGLASVAFAHGFVWGASRLAPALLGLVGHAVGVAAILLLQGPTWWFVAGVATGTAGWCLTGWLGTTTRSPVALVLRSLDPVLGWVPLAVASVGLPATAGLAAVQAGTPASAHPWTIVLALTALSYAAVTHLRVPDPVAVVASWAAFGAGLFAPLVAGDALAGGLGCAALIGSTLLLEKRRRDTVMAWVAWLAVAPAVFLLGQAWWPWFAGQTEAAQAVLALTAVGGSAALAAALVDQGGQASLPRLAPEHRWAIAPVAVGGLDLAAALAIGVTLSTDEVTGWACAVSGLVALCLGLVYRAGALAAGSVLLGWWAAFLLGDRFVPERPWVAVLVVLALLVTAQVLSRGARAQPWWARWDLPSVVTAAPVLVSGLALSTDGPHASVVYGVGGVECLAVAVRVRTRPPVAAALGVAGASLSLIGAAWAGRGWLALALLLLAVLLTIAAQSEGALPEPDGRATVGIAASAAAVASWWSAVEWIRDLGVASRAALDGSGLAAAAVLVAVASAARLRPAGRPAWLSWGGAAAAVEILVLGAILTPGVLSEVLPGGEPSWWLAAAGAVTGGAVMSAAPAVRVPWLREAGFALLALALVVVDRQLGLDATLEVAVLSLAGAVMATALFAIAAARGDLHRRRGIAGLGVVLTIWALATAFTSAAFVGSALLAAPLAVAAIQLAATGAAFGRAEIAVFSPVVASAAFVAFARDALAGEAQWVTTPIAIGLLVSVGLWRHLRGRRGESVDAREVVVVELLAITLLVVPALVQAVTYSLAHALVALPLALSVAAWGVVTRVRRRLAAGGAAVLAAVVVLVGVPLVNLLPSWEGPALWALIGAVGLGAVLVAAFLERGREVALSGLARFREATAGWE